MIKKPTIAAIGIMLILSTLTTFAKAATDDRLLRLALLPIVDVLPIFVAEENGYFKELGITVETLPVGSALERDQLMQAGRADGTINEISGAATFNRDRVQMKIVAIARSPIGSAPLFRIIGAPGSSISGVKDMAGVPIAISKNTVIEYITNRLIVAGGIEEKEIVYQSVPVLPERLQLLLSGRIKAATLPDPLGLSAIKAGAVEITNDTTLREMSASVISFSTTTVNEKTEVVKQFMVAWNKAVLELNAHPEQYKDLMFKKIRVPKNVHDSFSIPSFPLKVIPSQIQWDDVMAWMVAKKLLAAPLAYADTVTDRFL